MVRDLRLRIFKKEKREDVYSTTIQPEISRARSNKFYGQAKKYFPGGVNSPVRDFKSVEGVPLFIKKGDGCHIRDEDDNQFIDFCFSWGPLILGENNPANRESIVETMSLVITLDAPTRWANE